MQKKEKVVRKEQLASEPNPKIEGEDAYNAPNLEKGLAILELLSDCYTGKTLQEIRLELKISLTTAYRILLTLVRNGYLSYSEESKRYKTTTKMLTIGFRSVQEHDLLEKVLPRMRELRDKFKESIYFGILYEDHIVVLEQCVGTHSFCFYINPGKEVKIHCSAPGKAMMAFMPEDLRKQYLSKIVYTVYNSNTISNEEDFIQALEEVRQKGYACDLEEEVYGVTCVSAPILNRSEIPCGSIWTSGPRDRIPVEVRDRIGEELRDTCLKISEEMGYEVRSMR